MTTKSTGLGLGAMARFLAIACCVASMGCELPPPEHPLASTFATDFDCHGHVSVRESETDGRYLVMGCGTRAVYQCVQGESMCAIQTVKERSRAPDASSASSDRRKEQLVAEPHLESHGDQEVLTLEIGLDERSMLRLSGAPKQHPDLVQLNLLRHGRDEDVGECNLDCVITAAGVALPPVAGVRTYDSLQVGEAAYTLGSPVGLELTLSDGIVSGVRDEDGLHYVQTTAPISPGSSGCGLFDARGNLIGITTLVLVGREHLNQSLNFAIPADAFHAP